MLWYIGPDEEQQYILFEIVILQDWHDLKQKAP